MTPSQTKSPFDTGRAPTGNELAAAARRGRVQSAIDSGLPWNAQTVRAVLECDIGKSPLVTPAELKILRAFQARWNTLGDTITANDHGAGKRKFLAQNAHLRTASEDHVPSEAEAFQKKEFANEAKLLRAAAKQARRDLAVEAAPLLREVIQRVQAACLELATHCESAGRQEAETFGIEYRDSILWMTCHRINQQLESYGHGVTASPRTTLFWMADEI